MATAVQRAPAGNAWRANRPPAVLQRAEATEKELEALEVNKSKKKHAKKVNLSEAKSAAQDLHQLLAIESKILYAIQGSFAAALQGAVLPEPPGDVDVLVKNTKGAFDALIKSEKFKEAGGGSLAERKLTHIGTGTEIDLVYGEEFGIVLSQDTVQNKGGLLVLSLTEVLVSLLLRPERRLKEMWAFASLVLTRGHEADQKRVALIAKTKWEEVVENAKLAVSNLNIPLD